MLSNFKLISMHICKKRPGVATTMSGAVPDITLNCCSMDSPPRIAADVSPVNLPSSLTNLRVYI